MRSASAWVRTEYGGIDLMGDEDRSRDLPHRVRGSARDGSERPAGSPVLSEELRQRIQAAVKAERSQAAAKDQQTTAEPSKQATSSGPADGDVPGLSVNGLTGQRRHVARPDRLAKAGHAARPDRLAKAGRAARPDRVTRPGHAATPDHAAKPERAVTVRSEPTIDMSAHREQTAPWLARTPAEVPVGPPGQPEESAPQGRRWTVVRMVAMILVLIGVGSLVTAVSLRIANSSGGSSAAQTALQRQEAVLNREAASWVAQQVDRDDLVSCDQAMCAALRNAGFPADQLLVLRATSPLPVTSAVVVVTAAVRKLFGSSLESAWAPAVLASFGSGTAQVTIRVMAPNGAAAYLAALSVSLQNRKQFGAGLLGNSQIKLSAIAAQQLAAGQVDYRLAVALVFLASVQPVQILEFGKIGPGASSSLPLRFADLDESDPTAHLASPAYMQAMRTYLSTQSAKFRPVSSQPVTLPDGKDVFRIEFTAPSPFAPNSSQGTP
jgi:hypothetical protein